MNSNEIRKQALSMPIAKRCDDFDDFIDLMDDAKQSVKEIFFNGKKHDKRKTNFEDFKDVFDNNIPVRYLFNKRKLDVWIGNYRT